MTREIMAFNSTAGTEAQEPQDQQHHWTGVGDGAGGQLVIGGETTSSTLADVVESSVESLFQWATVAESSTFGLIWLTAVIGNGLITCTLLRRGLLTHPSNRFVITFRRCLSLMSAPVVLPTGLDAIPAEKLDPKCVYL
jgi:hypothetical protein